VAALDDRIGSQGGCFQVIETFHELGAGEGLRSEGVGQGLAYLTESYNCIFHNASPSHDWRGWRASHGTAPGSDLRHAPIDCEIHAGDI
jgi:hypothetical protein